ncbi:MAG: antibiotic biosynthesis monooxygenase [Terricaulis sp.]
MNYNWRGLRSSDARELRPEKCVCIVLKAETKPGLDDAFEAMLADFAHKVRSDEPGCTSYSATRALGSPTHFAVHARFISQSALEAHAETEHMNASLPRLMALLATQVSLEIFVEI